MGTKTQQLSNLQLRKLSNQIIDWQAVITGAGSSSTAVSGQGYFINTTSAVHTLNLPASPVIGDTITIVDYASTFASNNVTLNPNGNKIEAGTANGVLSTNDQTHTLIFTDSTQGWKIVNQDTAASVQPSFVTATGGTVTTSGDYKIHTFTGDADFIVSSIGNPLGGPNTSDYVVVAGGGGGGGRHGGGGGAGGFRESKCNTGTWTASPLATPTGIALTAQTYPVTVGGGGTGGNRTPSSAGTNGSNSVFSTITSTGGGRGHTYQSSTGQAGGSGGGGGHTACSGIPGGSGNTPPTSPPQGNNGGNGFCGGTYDYQGGGGGGATVAGGTAPSIGGGDGGAGATSSINGTPTARAGGGGGGTYADSPGGPGSGGSGGGAGGGGPNASPTAATAGTTNTGGGGGGYGGTNPGNPSPRCQGATGGSGIVIIRYKFQ